MNHQSTALKPFGKIRLILTVVIVILLPGVVLADNWCNYRETVCMSCANYAGQVKNCHRYNCYSTITGYYSYSDCTDCGMMC